MNERMNAALVNAALLYCLTPVWLFDNPLGSKRMSPFLVTVDIICSIRPCALIGQRLSD